MFTWKAFVTFFFITVGIASRRETFRVGSQHHRVINTNTVCGNTPGLTGRQTQLCNQYPHAVASAIQGMQIAIHECKEQFKNHRWNCSSLETKNKIPHTSTFLANANGNRETAFSYAIASAGVAHQVAYACSIGKIRGCECPQQQPMHLTASQRKNFKKQMREARLDSTNHVRTFERSGCDHNINYGMQFAIQFLDPRDEQDFISATRLHNNRVGRLIVANNMKESCKCHGTSGACSQRTCWSATPDFKAVGLAIKKKYKNATNVNQQLTFNQVRDSNEVQLSRNNRTTLAGVDNLVFLEDSPSYCIPDPSINVAGTKGRICNRTAGPEETNSCQFLCCSRGYKTIRVRRMEQCRCRFHWCCYVNCETCNIEETVSVCH